LGTSKRVER